MPTHAEETEGTADVKLSPRHSTIETLVGRLLEGDRGAVRLCDWSIAQRRMPHGSWQQAADALPQEQARPLALKQQLAGVVKLARGEPHHLATLADAFNVQEIVEGILAG